MLFSLRQRPLCISEQFHKTNSYFVPYAEPGGTFLLKPLQVTPKTKIKRNQLQIKSRGRRASASAPLKGSLTIEAAFVMCLLLAACVHLFYLFSLMGFQARMQLFLEKETRERAIYRISHSAGMREAARKELEPFSGLMSLDEGVSFQAEKDGDFLEASVQYRAGPAFGLWKADYTQTARRRLWNGQAAILHEGAGERDGWSGGVYVTPHGTAFHRTRDCAYLSLSVRAAGRTQLSGLRNKNGERYTACENCGERAGAVVYITDYGNRYHSARSCGGISRQIIKIPETETKGRTPCSKCG